jgi:hypothetical protein
MTVATVMLTHLTAKPDNDYTAWANEEKALFWTSAHREGPDGILIRSQNSPCRLGLG